MTNNKLDAAIEAYVSAPPSSHKYLGDTRKLVYDRDYFDVIFKAAQAHADSLRNVAQTDADVLEKVLDVLERGLDEICSYACNTKLQKQKMRSLIRSTCNVIDRSVKAALAEYHELNGEK